MNKTRLVIAGLCALTAGLAVAGCGKSSTGGGATAASTPSPTPLAPADALNQSIKPLTSTSYEFTVKIGSAMSGGGKADPANSGMDVTVNATTQGTKIKFEALEASGQLFMKYDLGTDANKQMGINPGKWLLIDTTKIKDKTNVPDAADITGLEADLSGNVTNVTRTDATHLTGTVDITKATGIISPDSDAVSKAGDKAKAVPFTETLDSQGRVVEFKTGDATTDPELSIDLVVSNYGATQTFTKPAAGSYSTAPSSVYDMLNG